MLQIVHETLQERQSAELAAGASIGDRARVACVLSGDDRDAYVAVVADVLTCQTHSHEAWGSVRCSVGAFAGRVYYEVSRALVFRDLNFLYTLMVYWWLAVGLLASAAWKKSGEGMLRCGCLCWSSVLRGELRFSLKRFVFCVHLNAAWVVGGGRPARAALKRPAGAGGLHRWLLRWPIV